MSDVAQLEQSIDQDSDAKRRSSDNHQTRPFSTRRSSYAGCLSESVDSEQAGPCSVAASDQSTLSVRQRVLAVKVEIDWKDADSRKLYQRVRDLSWAASRYRNGQSGRRWAEAMGWTTAARQQDKHSVTKEGRAWEKELGEPVKSAAEREVEGAWSRYGKEVLAGRPFPQWKPTAALSLRGRKTKKESGIRLELEDGQYVAYLRALSKYCAEGTWLRLPIARNTRRDEYQGPILNRMVSGDLPIAKATVQVKQSAIILRFTYALDIMLPFMGARVATLGPVKDGRLFLRTELQTKDYTSKLAEILKKKDEWDLIRRRVMAQIGRRKGHARLKRQYLARMSWEDWLHTYLHTWSAQIAEWMKSQGVGTLQIESIDSGDWPACKFTELLKYKAADRGIAVKDGADVSLDSARRSAKQEISREKRRIKKRAEAVRELTHQLEQRG